MNEIKNYLAQGNETEEGIDILISFTEMSSRPVRKALIRHYVNGAEESMACEMACVPLSNFSRAAKKLNDVARKIDQYHELYYKRNQIGDNNTEQVAFKGGSVDGMVITHHYPEAPDIVFKGREYHRTGEVENGCAIFELANE